MMVRTERGYFPQVLSSERGYILSAWQEYGENDRISIIGSVSDDGTSWSDPFVLIDEFDYTGEDRVSLFTMALDRNGDPIIALTSTETRILIYRLNTPGSIMEQISVISTDNTAVVARVFRRSDNSLMLFMTGRVTLATGTDALSIYYAESETGEQWTRPRHFVNDPELKQNFLPQYASDDSGEYVVFQSLFTGSRNTYQIYLKYRRPGGSWSDEILITSYSEYQNGENYEFNQYDNQRPHLAVENGFVHLVWERRLGRSQPQIVYAVLDSEGNITEDPEQISRGSYFTASPRILRRNGESLILWFDNRNNNQVVMAQKSGIFWDTNVLSLVNGDSTYARWLEHEGNLSVFWENQYSGNRNVVILNPDRTAPLPIVRTVNFTDGGRQSEDQVIISWRRPEDSSGIEGFSYVFDQYPDTEPVRERTEIDLRERTQAFRALEDGMWYFHIALVDYAGNWSGTVHINVTRDTVPPEPVRFNKPLTDAMGYLISNTFTLTWSSDDENLGGFSYAFFYLGEDVDFIDPSRLVLPTPPETVQTVSPAVQYNNRDNGHWALSVCAFDDVGNRSEPAVLLFRTNKYIPVTYISDVQTRRDELERVVLTLVGRGFSAGGDIRRVVIDRNGEAPWDYEFTAGEFDVVSDRVIQGPVVEVLEDGSYLVGVEHPARGFAFADGRLRLDSTGTVRFGDFTYDYKTFWLPVEMGRILFDLNSLMFYILVLLLFAVIVLSAWQIYRITRESRYLEEDVRSMIEGTPLRIELREERLKRMKQKGMGLRLKFTLALLSLILAVIMLISLFLGNYMINTQKQNLSEGLYDKSSLLLETLTTSARTYLPTQNRLELGLLPNTIRAMEDAVSTTITGQGANDPEVFSYIWSSNDPGIEMYQEFPSSVQARRAEYPEDWTTGEIEAFEAKFLDGDSFNFEEYDEEDRDAIYELLSGSGLISRFEAGNTRLDDSLSGDIDLLREEINTRARELIGDQSTQLDQLSEDAVRLALRGDQASLNELAVIQETISRVETEINDKLTTVSNIVQTWPEFNVDTLSDDQTVYTFYKPIVYRNRGRDSYFRGVVRLNISIDSILEGIVETRSNIVRITMIISLLALAGGLVGALLLAQTMINPIRKLVQGVERVRDTQDMTKLADYTIETGTRDELFELANTFNQMTKGLVVAAKANQELIMGKEIQKKFIPLETLQVGDRKLSTGEEENEHAHFFGYYEGAKGVSGDYFDFRKLDDKHYAVIKCDISGKGISAALIMVEVATIFIDFFSKLDIKRDGIHLDKLVYGINDLLEQVGFKGRFAAFIIQVINIETGEVWMCHAGDKNVYYYDGVKQKVILKELDESPAAGVFPSFMVDGPQAFRQTKHILKSGDILFLFTDGIEEAQRHFRTSEYKLMDCDGSCDMSLVGDESYDSHKQGEDFEELGIPRMEQIIESVLHKETYDLYQYHKPNPDLKLSFDFTGCEGTMKEAVLALISVEKVFRLVPDPSAGPNDRIRIDNKIDDFLKVHFDQYRDYFKYPIPDEEYPEYTYYSHLKEDEQFDDLTVLGIHKK
ncbi:MAG: SpoIIE family protein phosphatase [Spirochaetales bacterium]|nr:SpoIIE family protein phosphatase [Spirochaetales bacterium]